MSLTRDEWLKMWNSIKCIESLTIESERDNFQAIQSEWKLMEDCIRDIKKKVQSVIGQME